MCVSSQGGKTLPRAFKQREQAIFARKDGGPEGLLLLGIEEQAVVGDASLPRGAREGSERVDGRRGPGRKPFRSAALMEGQDEGAGSTVAGGENETSGLQPAADLSACGKPHEWVIR